MTQDECRKEFLELCAEIIVRIDKIDDQTPYSEVEPKWWLAMDDIRRKAVEEYLHRDEAG